MAFSYLYEHELTLLNANKIKPQGPNKHRQSDEMFSICTHLFIERWLGDANILPRKSCV